MNPVTLSLGGLEPPGHDLLAGDADEGLALAELNALHMRLHREVATAAGRHTLMSGVDGVLITLNATPPYRGVGLK